jgi:hypothetical protein
MTDLSENADFRAAQPKSSGGRIRVSGARLKEAALALAVLVGLTASVDYGRYYWSTGRSEHLSV